MKYINCALIGITILCLYVIGCVGLNIFPTLGFCQKADAINSVGLNLSYSFIAGWIFYLLITYFPYRFLKRKFSPIINGRIIDLCKQIEACVHTFSMEDSDVINSISKERLLGLIQAKGMYSQSCFAEQVGYQMNNLQFLVETKKNCFDIIEKLIPYKEYLTDKQIVCIEKIRDSSYFHLTKIYENSPVAQIYYNSEQFKNELSKELYDIICLLRIVVKDSNIQI